MTIADVGALLGIFLSSAAIAALVNGWFDRKRKRSNVDIAARLNDETLEWAATLKADAADARREVQELRRELAAVRLEAQGLQEQLARIRAIIWRHDMTIEHVRETVARMGIGDGGNGSASRQ